MRAAHRWSAVVVLGLTALAVAMPTSALARSPVYCTPKVNLCYGKLPDSRPLTLAIRLKERYFARYTLCVQRPGHRRACRSFSVPTKKRNGIYEARVRWRENFPYQGPGTYRARWRRPSGKPLGPAIHFRG